MVYGQVMALFVLITMFIAMARASRLQESSMFINSLKDDSKYDKRLRPYHRESTLNITVGMTILSFGEINEIEGEFSLDIFFRQTWIDPRLKHNNTGPVVLTGIHTNLIWLPDTFFINVRTVKKHDVPSSASSIKIQQNGEVKYSERVTLSAGCEIDLHRYPLDSQICKLRIMSYAYKKDEIEYQWNGDAKTDIAVMNDQMAQLIVTDIQRMKTTAVFREVHFSELVASFEFRRRLGYSLLQIYAPTFLVVTLSWLSFWISKNAVAARIALGVTTVLTIVTLNGSYRSTVPKVSYIKALDLYLIVSLFFVFGAVLEYIAVLLHHDYGFQSKVKNDKKEDQEIQEVNKENADQDIELVGTFSSRRNSTSKASKQSSSSGSIRVRNNAKAVDFIRNIISVDSTPIDKISKLAFPLSFILFNIVYWICYSV
ncbi:glycine receptor subunit alphaZ1-like [Actinia tenebrosa]|uniref:Glycine receptor subunit alphaZ1-like n=1 Tax=Actinia tenebrosa TaxID=6105 RepID=A0A6P8IBS6_ACTTE|nr:glycine receptor subunit alphaZ1-like [Actinia tenebrosa]